MHIYKCIFIPYFIQLPGDEENFSKTFHIQKISGDVFFSKIAFNITSCEIIGDDYTFTRMENFQKDDFNINPYPTYGELFLLKTSKLIRSFI